ncbi:Chemotaxis protein cheA [Candidatus Magnetomorum sp. HK-1]|nr:Chemotaxis protein cheA [Candidatus Magnetomorum sp. HK-1]
MLIDVHTHKIFIEDTSHYLEEIEKDLITLENMGAVVDKPFVERIFRSVHIIKNGAGLLGFSNIKELSQKLENVLVLICNGELIPNPEIINILLLGFDRLLELIEKLHSSNDMDIDEQSVMLTGLTSAVLPDNKKKSVTQIRAIPLPAKKHIFNVSEFNLLQVLNQGKNIYILEYDLIQDVQMKKITPLNFVRFVQQHGEMIDNFLDIFSVGTLEEKTPEHVMPYYILFASSLTSKQLAKKLDLRPDKIYELKDEFKDLLQPQEKNVRSQHDCHQKRELYQSNLIKNRLKNLSDLTNELNFAYNSLLTDNLEKKDSTFSIALNRINMVLTGLQQQVEIDYRIPASEGLWKLIRIVRDYGFKCGIPAKLNIQCTGIHMDKRITSQLIEPLSEMIIKMMDFFANSEKSNKNQNNNEPVQILFQMTECDKEVTIEIYSPDYSFIKGDTLLDLVEEQKKINALNSECSQNHNTEKGIVIEVKIPQSFSILDGFNTEIDNQHYIIPNINVKDWLFCAEISADDMQQKDNQCMILYQKKWIPLVDISKETFQNKIKYFLNKKVIVICEVGSQRIAVGVDTAERFEVSVVLQPLNRHLKSNKIIIASCLLNDGKIAFIPDMGFFAYKAIQKS